jgi:branched-chain amino acid transport system substrate-binding protein
VIRIACAAAALLAAAAVAAGCGSGAGGGSEGAVLTVYVSAPLTGPSGADGRALERGARAALAAAHGRAGKFRLRGVYLDDSRGGGASIVRIAANARTAAEHTDTIAYIGELGLAATRISLPITNQAEMPQIFPGTESGRTPVAPGPNPNRFEPSGKDTFVALSVPAGMPPEQRGARAMKLLIDAMARAGSSGSDRSAVLDELLKPQG